MAVGAEREQTPPATDPAAIRQSESYRPCPAVGVLVVTTRHRTRSGRSSSGWCDEIDPFAQAGLERVKSIDDGQAQLVVLREVDEPDRARSRALVSWARTSAPAADAGRLHPPGAAEVGARSNRTSHDLRSSGGVALRGEAAVAAGRLPCLLRIVPLGPQQTAAGAQLGGPRCTKHQSANATPGSRSRPHASARPRAAALLVVRQKQPRRGHDRFRRRGVASGGRLARAASWL